MDTELEIGCGVEESTPTVGSAEQYVLESDRRLEALQPNGKGSAGRDATQER